MSENILAAQGLGERSNGKENSLHQNRNTVADGMAEQPASSETEGDGGYDNAHLETNDAEKGLDIETISKEIRDLKTELKDVIRTFKETLRKCVEKGL